MADKKTGEIIRQLRKGLKLSQEALGKELGFSARAVSDWENGYTEPNIATIKAIVHFFDITYEEFFGDI